MNQFDVVAIGDLVTDAFIRLKDASVHCNVNRADCELCLRFADKVPYESVTVVPAVGNSANAAVANARLGVKAALLSNLGDDQNGIEALATLAKNGVDTTLVKTNAGQKTNYHYVLWYEDERTILIKHEAFDYQFPDFAEPKWIYLSSLGETSLGLHDALATYLDAHPAVKLAFQPGTFQMKIGTEKLAKIYERTEIFFCNVEEAKRILAIEESDVKKLAASIQTLGPKIVVITDGPKGAYLFQNGELSFLPPYPDIKPPFERTGAGDAFASTIVAALILGQDIKDAMLWGPINSMMVVQQIGAQAGLLARPDLEKFLAQAPADYKLKVI